MTIRHCLLCSLCILNLHFSIAQRQYASQIHTPDSAKFLADNPQLHRSSSIDKEDIQILIYTLAHDSMEGRELGHPGIDKAANFIASQLKLAGIPPCPGLNSYFQEIAFTWVSWNELKCNINGTDYRHLWDYLCLADQNGDLQWQSSEVVFMGYGIDDPAYSDYQNAHVKNKAILIFNGEPRKKNGLYHITKSSLPSAWSSHLQLKLDAAQRHGAKLVLIIEEKLKGLIDANRQSILSPKVIMGSAPWLNQPGVNYMHISSSMAANLIGRKQPQVIKWRNKINKTGKPSGGLLPCELKIIQTRNLRQSKGKNILAYIEGSDVKDEIIIITAHYDHIGKKGDDIFNGADDNASGTAALLEIARCFQENKDRGIVPRRSILCLWLTGEEKGLLGSAYYVNHPVFPLANTMANINIDMIGRNDDIYLDSSNYVYVIGSDRMSKDLHSINEEVNDQFSRLILDYTYNSEKDPNRFYYRSDHYNFAENGIPAIFFFSGTHADYHRTTDDADKIDFEKTARIARHIFQLAWALSMREKPLSVSEP